MTDDFQVWISRVLLDVAKTTMDLQTQLNQIKTLTVNVRAVIDQSQLQKLETQTGKASKGFQSMEQSSKRVAVGTGKVAVNTGKMAKNITVGAHQHNKIAQQMGVWQQFTIAMARVPEPHGAF